MNPSRPDPRGLRELRGIQRTFATGIMRPLDEGGNSSPTWPDGRPAGEVAAGIIKPNDRLDSHERLEIYNRQYWFRLLDSLREDFPGLRALIGEDRFFELSLAYLKEYSSRSFTLRDLGDRLEKFLVRHPHWIEEEKTLALDLVRLEWAHIVAFDGEARPALELDSLLGSDPSKLRLGLQPCLTLLACDYPIDDYLLKIRRREEPRGEASNAVSERVSVRRPRRTVAPQPEKIWLAVHRLNDSVYYKRLDPAPYAICAALQRGLTLDAACAKGARLRKDDPNFATNLQSWFSQWAAFGWFCARD